VPFDVGFTRRRGFLGTSRFPKYVSDVSRERASPRDIPVGSARISVFFPAILKIIRRRGGGKRERERERGRESPLGENQRVSLILPLFGDARGRRRSPPGAFILSFVIQVVPNYGTAAANGRRGKCNRARGRNRIGFRGRAFARDAFLHHRALRNARVRHPLPPRRLAKL